MLDMKEIDVTIDELENSITTLDNCKILADLYIVKQYYNNRNMPMVNDIEEELNDILPTYRRYCEVKKQYQLHELNVDVPIKYMKDVCKEIKEFIQILYTGTDTIDEREIILNMIKDLQEVY